MTLHFSVFEGVYGAHYAFAGTYDHAVAFPASVGTVKLHLKMKNVTDRARAQKALERRALTIARALGIRNVMSSF